MYIKDIAIKAHGGQTRRGNGEPYINHCARIVANIDKYVETFSSKCVLSSVAWMHDVLEDCVITPEIIEALVEHNITTEVNLLTRKSGQSKDEYLLGILGSKVCILIKGLDRIDNLADIKQIKNPVDYIYESKLILAGVKGLPYLSDALLLKEFIVNELTLLIEKAEKELNNGNEYSGD